MLADLAKSKTIIKNISQLEYHPFIYICLTSDRNARAQRGHSTSVQEGVVGGKKGWLSTARGYKGSVEGSFAALKLLICVRMVKPVCCLNYKSRYKIYVIIDVPILNTKLILKFGN